MKQAIFNFAPISDRYWQKVKEATIYNGQI